MGDVSEIREGLLAGDVDPQEAVEAFELSGSKHISEGSLDELTVPIIDCGFPRLNAYKAFKRKGELIILGARPSHGKSALMLQLASNIAKEGNVLVISMEMGFNALKVRACALVSNRAISDFTEGKTSKKLMQETQAKFSKLNLRVIDKTAMNVNEIISIVKAHHKSYGLSAVFIDYLQLVRGPGTGTKRDEIGYVTEQLRDLAREIDRPIMALSGLNRSCEERGKKQQSNGKAASYLPAESDISESDRVGYIADVVILLSRQDKYDSTRPNTADIGVTKNREGKTGWEEFIWNGSKTKFIDEETV